jgi:hypothetical protein
VIKVVDVSLATMSLKDLGSDVVEKTNCPPRLEDRASASHQDRDRNKAGITTQRKILRRSINLTDKALEDFNYCCALITAGALWVSVCASSTAFKGRTDSTVSCKGSSTIALLEDADVLGIPFCFTINDCSWREDINAKDNDVTKKTVAKMDVARTMNALVWAPNTFSAEEKLSVKPPPRPACIKTVNTKSTHVIEWITKMNVIIPISLIALF